jgi:very-short-patch-repair endonuclease
MPELTEKYLIETYIRKEKSMYEIAEECGTYPNKVKRALERYAIPIRTRSEAQSVAIQSGRHEHPTKGKKHSEKTRNKISSSIAKVWQEMSAEEKDKRVQVAKQQWLQMDPDQQEEFRKLAAEAVRKTAKEGSRLERFILVNLRRAGYNVEFHKEHLLSREGLQVDLYLPDNAVAIEIDGPAHFYPIWGTENLSKHIASDNAKTGLLIQAGLTLIRVKHVAKNLSKFHERKLLTEVVNVLKSIESQSSKYFEIELR